MERVYERLELDRELLTIELRGLRKELEDLRGEMAVKQEDLKELREDHKDMACAFRTLGNLGNKIPGLWPARDPVCEKLLEMTRGIERIEDDLESLLGLYQEKKMAYKDIKQDFRSIKAYLDTNKDRRRKGIIYKLPNEKIIAREKTDMEAGKEKNPIQHAS